MKARFAILVVILLVVAGVWAFREPPSTTLDFDEGVTSVGDVKGIRVELGKIPVPGVEPPVPPEFDVTVEVDTTEDRNKLIYRITEKHGFFVDLPTLSLYFKPTGGTEADEVFAFQRLIVDYIPTNDTLTSVDFVVPAELDEFGGSIGDATNWRAEVTDFGRVRTEDPPQDWEGYKVREDKRE